MPYLSLDRQNSQAAPRSNSWESWVGRDRTALDISGDAATGINAVVAILEPNNAKVITKFKECLNNIIWSGAIGNNYSFDERGDVTDIAPLIVEAFAHLRKNHGQPKF